MPPTPRQVKQSNTMDLIRGVLGDKLVMIKALDFSLKEDIANELSLVSCSMLMHSKRKPKTEIVNLSGKGKGMIDALFTSAIEKISPIHPSLKNLKIESFSVSSDTRGSKNKYKSSKTDASVTVNLYIDSGLREALHFQTKSRSLATATILVVKETIEYFINSELAILTLKRAVADAEKRRRNDLYQKYTMQMSELVENNSYSDLLKEEK